jgi:hypothetical protein
MRWQQAQWTRIVVATMLVAAGTVAHGGPAGAAASWSVVPSASPAGTPDASFFDVACPSETSCFAVGGSSTGPLAEHWDGTRWSIMPVPASGGLRGISCANTTSCMAVGAQGDKLLAARWDGTSWSSVTFADPGGGSFQFLSSVDCSSATSCTAVGYEGSSAAVTASWNGTAWSIVPSPHVPGKTNSLLSGVSCTSAASCFAVGSSYDIRDENSNELLIEQWDGVSWSIVASPSLDGGHDSDLGDVSCSSEMSCFAVGNYIPKDNVENVDLPQSTLIESWDGVSWSVVASPNVASATTIYLQGVSCSSDTDCFAVGAVETAGGPLRRGLIEHWDGDSWSISANPLVDPAYSQLRGVMCPSSTTCFAVGNQKLESPQTGLIEYWNGASWSATAYPPVNPRPPHAALAGVACATATTCFGVGRYTNSAGTTVPLIERPTATGWSVVGASALKGAGSLSSVSCPSTATCVAAGTSGSFGAERTLITRWNGTAWSIMPSPNATHAGKPLNSFLLGVSCSSAKSCFAVGYSIYYSFRTLIERWDGKSWTIVPSPNRSQAKTALSILEGVSCTSATNCFAVGRSGSNDNQASAYRTLTERWNGIAWTIVPSPNAVSGVGELAGVSCASATACVAVGNAYRYSVRKSLIETWNGTAWTRVTSADPPSATHSALSGVSCASPTSCAAAGNSSGASKQNQTLVKTLAGGHWTIESSANPTGAKNSYLNAVWCRVVTSCVAAGSYDATGSTFTLVERRS